jgi:hypothetical protein
MKNKIKLALVGVVFSTFAFTGQVAALPINVFNPGYKANLGSLDVGNNVIAGVVTEFCDSASLCFGNTFGFTVVLPKTLKITGGSFLASEKVTLTNVFGPSFTVTGISGNYSDLLSFPIDTTLGLFKFALVDGLPGPVVRYSWQINIDVRKKLR